MPPANIGRHRHRTIDDRIVRHIAIEIAGMARVGYPHELHSRRDRGENARELFIADRVLVRPIEIDRTDALIELVHLTLRISRRELPAVSAIMEHDAVATSNAIEQPS